MPMISTNFEFLRQPAAELADLGGFAEAYLDTDPNSALIKIRMFAENIVTAIFQINKLQRPYYSTFNDLLNEQSFIDCVPDVVINKLHILRINGNKAAHGAFTTPPAAELVLRVMKEAFDLGQWFFLAYLTGKKEDLKQFTRPTSQQRLDRHAQDRIAAQEAQLASLLEQLDTARKEAATFAHSHEELVRIKAESKRTADALSFSEADTRKFLIDQALRDAGWNVSLDGSSTSEVGQEVPVGHQPTASGNGSIDYVLYDDAGKALAVVEAKKTSVDVTRGKEQANLYAEGIQKDTGAEPFIFYTNGYEIRLWNTPCNEPPRKIFGFYSKDSLLTLRFQKENRKPLNTINHDKEIIERPYQVEAIRQVTERITAGHRKSLVVQATGTGKTRVAVALSDLLSRAKWAKRILFLCDRKELRKQADRVFAEFMDGEPRTTITRTTAKDTDKRIYLATYPSMMKAYSNFDVGFFDLIIADESHRSIYNRYHNLFKYFDAFQVGLTATPIKYIARNTYKMFGCEDQDPTAKYTYEEAVEQEYLTPMAVTKHTTKFLRQGIKYTEMSDKQKEQAEDEVEDPETIDYHREEVDKKVFNKDTDRKILRNLMENGIRSGDGVTIGKSIIFARNHDHAVIMNELFDEMYPQFGGNICKVIDNYEPRAEHLIDVFKEKNSDLKIAISVDMLDTGIDVPEVVNLVFAKPVKSYVKFWQMIGRGTRLCKDLFGPGLHKTHFQIFDHWGNFEYFSEEYKEKEPPSQKSLFQALFESRIDAAEAAHNTRDAAAFNMFIELIIQDIRALPGDSVSVKEKWREVQTAKREDFLRPFDATVRTLLRNEIAPLMQWRTTDGQEKAYDFDLRIARTQSALLTTSATFTDFKAACQEVLEQLPETINAVREKSALIDAAKAEEFWTSATINSLEDLRIQIRSIAKYRQIPTTLVPSALRIDISDGDEHVAQHTGPVMADVDDIYRRRVRGVLDTLFSVEPALKKIKRCQPVTEVELAELVRKVHISDPSLRIDQNLVKMPDTSGRLDVALRHIIGLEPEVVDQFFAEFLEVTPSLTPHQIRFLGLLKGHIAQYGKIELESLWEAPFTSVHNDGIDGVFENEEQADKLIVLLKNINTYVPNGKKFG
jgi:type I restriction enzyme R subunit